MSITKFIFLFAAAPILVVLCLTAYAVMLVCVGIGAMFNQLKEDINANNISPKKIAVITFGAAVQVGLLAWLL